MEYAANRPTLPSRRSLVAPLVALLVGASIAIGCFALIDDGNTVTVSRDVVFVPGPGTGVRGLDDMANAPQGDVRSGDSTPKVAPYLTHGGPPTSDPGAANRTDPHGPAPFLHR